MTAFALRAVAEKKANIVIDEDDKVTVKGDF